MANAQGDERRRRAVACRLGRLTGNRAPRWSGEISEQDWRTVLAAGAVALAEAGTVAREAVEEEHATCTTCGARLNRVNTGTLCNPCQAAAASEQESQQQATAGRRLEPDRDRLADTAREFARSAAARKDSRVVDRTRMGRVEALIDELLAARPASALDVVGEDERKLVAAWSPFRNGPRHIVLCADGSRRYGNGALAPEH
ncbi:hypothetical protein [Kitasatospora sp. NPDC048538]|uniref:hypothetical protein n=1 Tax=unclassified Kitasatospora TaxID=2633591 RepID=UPI0033D20674